VQPPGCRVEAGLAAGRGPQEGKTGRGSFLGKLGSQG
jgi:hypothetical protein